MALFSGLLALAVGAGHVVGVVAGPTDSRCHSRVAWQIAAFLVHDGWYRVIRTDRLRVAGPASRTPAESRSGTNCGKSLPTPLVVSCTGFAASLTSTALTRSALAEASATWPDIGPTSAVVPSSNARRAGSALSHRAIGRSALKAAARSTKAVMSGSKRTGDSPVNVIVACLRGVTGCVAGTTTGRTGASVRTDGPRPGC